MMDLLIGIRFSVRESIGPRLGAARHAKTKDAAARRQRKTSEPCQAPDCVPDHLGAVIGPRRPLPALDSRCSIKKILITPRRTSLSNYRVSSYTAAAAGLPLFLYNTPCTTWLIFFVCWLTFVSCRGGPCQDR